MWQTSTRLLQLLAMLQARRDWSGRELASRLEVSTRTIRTDIERLRDLGYPATGAGVAGIEEASLRALVKLEQLMPSRLRHRIDAMRTATVSVVGTGPTVDPEVLSAIA